MDKIGVNDTHVKHDLDKEVKFLKYLVKKYNINKIKKTISSSYITKSSSISLRAFLPIISFILIGDNPLPGPLVSISRDNFTF